MENADHHPRIGSLDVSGECWYTNEADLRDALAAHAWMCGWSVTTEVTLPSGGRADLVLTAPESPTIVVELKVSLSTQRQYRTGFQQADSYRRFYTDSKHGVVAFLAAAKLENVTAQEELMDAYQDVHLRSWSEVSRYIRGGWPRTGRTHRTGRAHRRSVHLDRFGDLARSNRSGLAAALRHDHIRNLDRNYPAMADMLRRAVAA